MSWMWNKFNDDWSNQYEIINSLKTPCQHVFACYTVTDEINNGGFNQLFFNSTGQYTKMSQIGFKAIGCNDLSHIIKQAIDIYKNNRKTLEKYNDGTIKSFGQSYEEELFNELDNQFFKECHHFDKLIINYIRINSNFFGY